MKSIMIVYILTEFGLFWTELGLFWTILAYVGLNLAN